MIEEKKRKFIHQLFLLDNHMFIGTGLMGGLPYLILAIDNRSTFDGTDKPLTHGEEILTNGF